MNDKQKTLVRRLSLALIVFAMLFATLSSYLYTRFHINLMLVATPLLIAFLVVLFGHGIINRLITGCAITRQQPSSFGQQKALPADIKGTESEDKQTDTKATKEAAPSSALDLYEAMQLEEQRKEAERRKDILNCINDYVRHIVVGYLSQKSLDTLLFNIECLAFGRTDEYRPLRSDIDKKLKSPDLRHLAWNIGERLGVSRRVRAEFILASFPKELEQATVNYLEANLRDTIPCHIKIDVPDKGDYRFHYTPQAAS